MHVDQDENISLPSRDGWAILSSSLVHGDGSARFAVLIPAQLAGDLGARYLVRSETIGRGYEYFSRAVLESSLATGDLFLDVGAHWGYFSLQAVTHPAGDIHALAFEPDPTNGSILFHNIIANGVADRLQLVSAACGDQPRLAPLVTNASSMGHSIDGVNFTDRTGSVTEWVSVVTLDQVLENFPQHAHRRVVLKIDAEGLDGHVLKGARRLIASGRLAVVQWEFGDALKIEAKRMVLAEMLGEMSALGYRHRRFTDPETGSEMVDFRPDDDYQGNVFTFAPGLER